MTGNSERQYCSTTQYIAIVINFRVKFRTTQTTKKGQQVRHATTHDGKQRFPTKDLKPPSVLWSNSHQFVFQKIDSNRSPTKEGPSKFDKHSGVTEVKQLVILVPSAMYLELHYKS